MTYVPVQPYENSWSYLRDKLRQLDLMIETQLLRLRALHAANPLDQFKGLVVSEEEVATLLAQDRKGAAVTDSAGMQAEELGSRTAQLSEMTRLIEARLQRSPEKAALSLPRLGRLFGLTPFEEACVLICLAPELDRKYEKLYAYLQDDITRKKPTLDLVLSLLAPVDRVSARAAFAPQASLIKYGLIRVQDQGAEGLNPLLYRPLKLEDRVVSFLLDQQLLDARVEPFTKLLSGLPKRSHPAVSGSWLKDRLVDLLRPEPDRPREDVQPVLVHFHGPAGSGKQALVQTVAHELGLATLLADAAQLAASPLPFEETALRLVRESLLQPALLCLDNLDALLTGDEMRQQQLSVLIKTTLDLTRTAVLLSRRGWTGQGLRDEGLMAQRGFFISVPLAMPDETMRAEIWQENLRGLPGSPAIDCSALASRFSFTSGQIHSALTRARHQAFWRTGSRDDLSAAVLYSACREQSDQSLAMLAKKMPPQYDWSDIILPDDTLAQLREICQRVTLRRRVLSEWGFEQKLSLGIGVNALFAGPSGTGKTMAAEVIANELELDLYRIDLSGVVSKYIGETEKNLDRIFAAAREANAILFFDEADALFGKRSEVRDSHDRYANIEVSYLLQKMEEYEGVALLATNLRQNLDDAFIRRLAFTIHFPFPDEPHRRRIWGRIWPKAAPLGHDVDLDLMARQFKLSGGNIRNIALAAAFLAAGNGNVVTMNQLLQATRREYQKLGKPLSNQELGLHHE